MALQCDFYAQTTQPFLFSFWETTASEQCDGCFLKFLLNGPFLSHTVMSPFLAGPVTQPVSQTAQSLNAD